MLEALGERREIGYCDLVLLDSSAWIELFDATEQGKQVHRILSKNDCYSSIVTLAEVTSWALRKGINPNPLIDIITKTSSILDLDDEIVILAGRLHFERRKKNKKWGMLDSFILATARTYELKVLTKDNDFKDILDAEIL